MASAGVKQDMPPEGGYRPIAFSRIPAKQYFSGYTMFLGFAGMTAAACYVYWLTYKKVRRQQIEMRSSELALRPVLMAERDRAFLKQLRRNRDEEAELMANVKGWEVGTYYGEPIYKTLPPDQWVNPIIQEYYEHARYKDYSQRVNIGLWS